MKQRNPYSLSSHNPNTKSNTSLGQSQRTQRDTTTGNALNLSSRGKDATQIEAKRILDQHINYFTKETYYKLREELMTDANEDLIQMLLDYKDHSDSDLLLSKCIRYHNQQEYDKMFNHSQRYDQSSRSRLQQQDPYQDTIQSNRNGTYIQPKKNQSPNKSFDQPSQSQRALQKQQLPFAQMGKLSAKKSPNSQNLTLCEIRDILNLTQHGYDIDEIVDSMIPYTWYNPLNSVSFSDLMRRTFAKEIQKAQQQKTYVIEEVLFSLFLQLDVNKDFLLDKDELEKGLRGLLKIESDSRKQSSNGNNEQYTEQPPQKRYIDQEQQDSQTEKKIDCDELFKQIDIDMKGKIFLRELEQFIEIFLGQMIKRGKIEASNDEMKTLMIHNVALEIFKRCDYYKDGIIDRWEFTKWINGDPTSVSLLIDLIDESPDYESMYRDILYKNIALSSQRKQQPSPSPQKAFIQDQDISLRVKPSQSQNQLKPKTIHQIQRQSESVQGKKEEQTETVCVKKEKPVPRNQRMADCSGFSSGILANQNQQRIEQIKDKPQAQQQIVTDFEQIFEDQEYLSAEEKLKLLSSDSGLKKINALQFSRKIKKQLEILDIDDGLTFEDFKSIIEPELKRVATTSIEKKGFEKVLKQIFDIFDENKNGQVDQREMSNCMALMCGGSVIDKIQAAFILFDVNNSNTLSLDELTSFMNTVFKVFFEVLNKSQSIIGRIDLDKMTQQTALKCFEDLKLPITQEISYEFFLQWLTQKPIFDQKQLQVIEKNQPVETKIEFADKIKKSAKDYVEKFIERQKFIEVINDIRSQSFLENVKVSDAVKAFEKFKGQQSVNKQGFFEVMRELIYQYNPNLKKNQSIVIEETLKKMYSLFDTDKNGILDLNEIIAALSILCKGSIQSKINALVGVFSQADSGFTFPELKKYFLCIFKLSLETNKEIILDFDIEKLADLTTRDCFDYNLEDDLEKGTIDKDGIIRWTKKHGGKIM